MNATTAKIAAVIVLVALVTLLISLFGATEWTNLPYEVRRPSP